jgi:hypothetical protein
MKTLGLVGGVWMVRFTTPERAESTPGCVGARPLKT